MKICQTELHSTLAALRAGRDAAAARGVASLVELRLDGLPPRELDVAGALADRRLPALVTCRPRRQGGRFIGTEDERLAILAAAARGGAEFVDIEFDALDRFRALLADAAPALVVSHHDFTPGVPDDLGELHQQMRAAAAASGPRSVVKIAITANAPRDCARLRRALFAAAPVPDNAVTIAMGPAGALTRMVPSRFSSAWTFAGQAAPGQLPIEDLVSRYRVDKASAATRVFGVAGAPLGHSASPAMHTAAFAAAGIDAVFVPFETADADELFDLADALGVEGLAVTAPLKSAVMTRAEADEAARAIGAMNTLKRRADGSGWDGRNFDAAAFAAPLEAHAEGLRGRRAVVIGAGGAARAAVSALAGLGAAVDVSARDRAAASSLAASLGATVTAFPPTGAAAIIVNATPVGTAPHAGVSPVPAGAVDGALAYDLVYNPEDTQFLKDARAHGARTIGGLAMLVAQAARQCEWWTGIGMPAEVFAQAAREFIR